MTHEHRLTYLHGDKSFRITPGDFPACTTDCEDFPEVGSEGILCSSIDGVEVWVKVRITKNEGGAVAWEERC